MFMLDFKDSIWWYWTATCVCLWITLTVCPYAYISLFLITFIQIIHLRWLKKSLTDFAIQIRLAFFLYLVMCLPESMNAWLWLPAIGSLARILFGYCLLARILMLLPFNRQERLSWPFVAKVFISPPVKGSIQHAVSTLI